MKAVTRSIGLFLLLFLAAALVIALLTAGGPAAQDEVPTATPVGGTGQNPLDPPTPVPGGEGQSPLDSGSAAGGSTGDDDTGLENNSGSCYAALVPLIGLTVLGAYTGRRRRRRWD